MTIVLIIAVVWVVFAGVFVLALCLAAKRASSRSLEVIAVPEPSDNLAMAEMEPSSREGLGIQTTADTPAQPIINKLPPPTPIAV